MGLVKIHIPPPARSGRRSLVQLARTGGWYDDDTFPKLLDMRQSCFIRKLQNRRKSLGSARIVLCGKDGAGKGRIPTEHSRKGGTIPANHAAKADLPKPMAKERAWRPKPSRRPSERRNEPPVSPSFHPGRKGMFQSMHYFALWNLDRSGRNSLTCLFAMN